MPVANITVEQFITDHKLKLTSHEVTIRPDKLMSDSCFHFRCRISQGSRGFSFYWSQGSGLPAMSAFNDVLDILAADACGYENCGSFEEWAAESGYEPDSRSAERVWKAVKRQSEQLKRLLLGNEAYEQLIWNVNR
jgi:hypothetical protein